MYYLMNKDSIVGSFDKDESNVFETVYKEHDMDRSKTPYGYKTIDQWLESRKASKHNAHLKRIMAQYGCENTEGFLKLTHAASINDTFWVKNGNETCTWDDISLYRNPFTEVVSRLAFEGVGIPDLKFSITSPELTSEGSYRKCFIKESNGIYLYKRGFIFENNTEPSNAGLEPYCEAMASELAERVCNHAVHYDITNLHGKLASKCRLFTDEKYGYAPFYAVSDKTDLQGILKYFEHLGSEDEFRRMIILDSLILNIDRHEGNYGILFDNDTLKPVSISPVFDFNRSLLPYYTNDNKSLGDYIFEEASPKVGDDFTRTAQILITPEIRKTLSELKDFEFTFQGDDLFQKNRVQILESIVQKQIDAVLSNSVLYTKDVFIPELHNKMMRESAERQAIIEERRKDVDSIENVAESAGYMVSEISDQNNLSIQIEKMDFTDSEIMLTLDFLNKTYLLEIDGKQMSLKNTKFLHSDDIHNFISFVSKFTKLYPDAQEYVKEKEVHQSYKETPTLQGRF